MHATDVIADMLTRIRNAADSKHETVDIPASKLRGNSGYCWMKDTSRR